MKKPELLSPVQDFVSLRAAIDAGADAVYFGLKKFSMRAKAKNFELKELKEVVNICHKEKIKAYLTLNTIIYENELEELKQILKSAKQAKIDAVHAWDMAVVREAKKLNIPVHLSTQASVSNSESALFYKNLGIKRIILARECSLDQIKDIKNKAKIEIETFVHGAMCVAVSGRCFTSQFLFKKSANRGECLQPCRRKYFIEDVEEHHRLQINGDESGSYVMSPKDLCTLPFIDKLIKSGIDSFKIEGRNRSPEYVKEVTEAYRAAIDNGYTPKLLEKVKNVYNRGFCSGFYLGLPTNDDWTDVYGSKAQKKKIYIGKIIHFYPKIKVAELKVESNGLSVGDKIMIQGSSTGIFEQILNSMEVNHKRILNINKGLVAIKLNNLVRKKDKVFVVK